MLEKVIVLVLVVLFQDRLCSGSFFYSDWGIPYQESSLEKSFSINRSKLFNPDYSVTETLEDLEHIPEGEDKWTYIEMKVLQVAFYLRFHKFSIEDPRIMKTHIYEGMMKKQLFQSFPEKPVKFDDYVSNNCMKSFFSCLFHITEKINSNSVITVQYDKPTLDLVKHRLCGDKGDHKKFCPLNKELQSYENKLYCKAKRKQDFYAMTETDRYRFVTTSMYFMCWYTLQKVSYLARMAQCDSRYRCENVGQSDGDIRANPDMPFHCALHSFCPDPCCRVALNNVPGLCETLPSNPCRLDNPPNKRQCRLDLNQNTNLNKIYTGRMNLTCHCIRVGTAYNVLTKHCEDINECLNNPCDKKSQDCFNTRGGFLCVCKWGLKYQESLKRCIIDKENPTNYYFQYHEPLRYNQSEEKFNSNHEHLLNSSLRRYESIFDEFISKVANEFYKVKFFFSSNIGERCNNFLLEMGLLMMKLLNLNTDIEKVLNNCTKEKLVYFKLDAQSIYQNMTEDEKKQLFDGSNPK